MSTAATEAPARGNALARLPWSLWGRQALAILRLEVRKSFLGRRALPLYLLALTPVFVATVWNLVVRFEFQEATLGDAGIFFAHLYQGFYLKFALYFGCVWIFMNLFRGEVLDRSLHYYLLAPVRREVLVASKYLAGGLASVLLFGGSAAAAFGLSYLPFGGAAREFVLGGPGLGHAAAYTGVTVLACLGYGAIFLFFGLLIRNPIIPALAIWGWEAINFLLPPLLKKASVVFYLKSLYPVAIPDSPFAILADPTPAWIAVPGLLLVAAALVTLAALRIRGLEIRYTDD